MTRGQGSAPAARARGAVDRFLDVVERVGNALPDPTTLFALLALTVSCYLLIWPGLRLSQGQDRSMAMQLFNRASYYPLALLAVMVVKMIIPVIGRWF